MSNKYNINYESSDIQVMSEEKASAYKLWKTVNEYLGGNTMFFSFSEQSRYTYEDFVSYIGVDASNYFFDTKNKARTYTWIAKDNETAKFSALFKLKSDEDKWTLNFSGSTNLMTEPEKTEDEPAEESENISEKTKSEDINVDEILNGLKEELKLDFDSSKINASGLAGSLIALMGAGLFAAGLSTMAGGDLSKTAAQMDLSSSEPQKICDQMTTSEVLKKTHAEWLEGKYVFKGTAYELLTYEQFKEKIGCEATVYYYDKIQNARVYTWLSQDDKNYSLCVWFKQKGESWNLYMLPPQ